MVLQISIHPLSDLGSMTYHLLQLLIGQRILCFKFLALKWQALLQFLYLIYCFSDFLKTYVQVKLLFLKIRSLLVEKLDLKKQVRTQLGLQRMHYRQDIQKLTKNDCMFAMPLISNVEENIENWCEITKMEEIKFISNGMKVFYSVCFNVLSMLA